MNSYFKAFMIRGNGMKYREKGFVFISVLGLMILIISVAMSVSVLNMSYSGDVAQSKVNKKLYYLANAGLELVYGAMNNEKSVTGTTELSAVSQIRNEISALGSEIKPDKYQMQKTDLPIKVNKEVVGYTTLSGKLLKRKLITGDGKEIEDYYYKILSKARVDKDEIKPEQMYTLTMFVFIESPNAPLIYNGDRDKPE